MKETVDPAIKEMFPDWDKIKEGEWSDYGKIIQTVGTRKVEIGLYREPVIGEEFDKTLTLQIFVNDDVVVCEQVSVLRARTPYPDDGP